MNVSQLNEQARATLGDEELAKQVAEQIQKQVFPDHKLEEEWFFGWEIEGPDHELEVDADGGRIILENEVENYDQFQKVLETARKAPGVQSVDSSGLRIDYNGFLVTALRITRGIHTGTDPFTVTLMRV